MLHLSAEETREALPMPAAIEAMEEAFSGSSDSPLRTLVGRSLVMPGRLDETVAVKVVSVVPGSPEGIVAVFRPDGSPMGIVDGPTLTALRTGAVCGLATRLLAKEECTTLAMLGAGSMALDQIRAVQAVRAIERVLVWSRTPERARSVATRVGGESVESVEAAVSMADVVSCATPATEPLFNASAVRPGTHVNAVGAFTPEMAELPADLLGEAFVVVDDRDAAAAEAGDLLRAARVPDATLAELLAGLAGSAEARTTVFKSVGIAAQDVAAARMALARAAALGIGTRLS